MRIFIILFFCAFVCCYSQAQSAQRPNIFVVLVDDLGYGDLGITGHPVIQTPNIDSFALKSRQLKYYAAHSVCTPSRVGLLTGQFPQRQGVLYASGPTSGNDYELKSTEPSIPQVLQDIGYSTFFVGKWHMSKDFANLTTDSMNQALGFDIMTKNSPAPSKIIFDKAEEYIQQFLNNDTLKPIFGYVALSDVHTPIIPKIYPPYDQYITTYQYDSLTSDQACHYGSRFSENNDVNLNYNIRYHHCLVSSVDAAFGRFLSFLDSLGIRENSIILFTSDNGPAVSFEAWGSPGCNMSGDKAQLYEGGVRVPGFIAWPGRWDDGDTIQTPTCMVDLLPTLAHITGAILPNPSQIDGQNATGIWDKTDFIRKKPLFWMQIWPDARDFDFGDTGGFLGQVSMLSENGNKKILGQLTCFSRYNPNYTVSNYSRRADFGASPRNLVMFDLQNDPLEEHNVAQTDPSFSAMYSKFLILNKQIRRSAPPYLSESKRYNIQKICSACDSFPMPLCPEGPLLTLNNTVPDLAAYANMTRCSSDSLNYYQWPPIGTPFTDSVVTELHIIRGEDHLKVCKTYLVMADEPPLIFSFSRTNQKNCISPDGSIDIFVRGGIPPYQFNWSNGSTSKKIEGLLGGTYSVTVTSSTGLSTQKVIKITNIFLDDISIFPTIQNVNCNEIASATATGGDFYNWSHSGGNDSVGLIMATSNTIFSVTVTDSLGCYSILSTKINVAEVLVDSIEVVVPECPSNEDSTIIKWVGGVDKEYRVRYSFLNDTNNVIFFNVLGNTATLFGLQVDSFYQLSVARICGSVVNEFAPNIVWKVELCSTNVSISNTYPAFILYPNPAQKEIDIIWSDGALGGTLYIDLYDIHSKLLKQQKTSMMQGNTKMDISALPAGCYVLYFKRNEAYIGSKIFVKIN